MHALDNIGGFGQPYGAVPIIAGSRLLVVTVWMCCIGRESALWKESVSDTSIKGLMCKGIMLHWMWTWKSALQCTYKERTISINSTSYIKCWHVLTSALWSQIQSILYHYVSVLSLHRDSTDTINYPIIYMYLPLRYSLQCNSAYTWTIPTLIRRAKAKQFS